MTINAIRPSLLVSIHDVSPLTLANAQRAVELVQSVGIPKHALTLLVIPRHENRAPLDRDLNARCWLARLADRGASLAIHGLTHRMCGATYHPARWLWAHGFARGQGEFQLMPENDAGHRICEARAIFRRAGLEREAIGFVPPAWLLSPGALMAVRNARFAFHEQLSGIVHRDGHVRARRLIGFGSLSGFEARITALYGRWQARREPTDLRFAIHPADLDRSVTTAAIRRTLTLLLDRLHPMNYTQYLSALAPTNSCAQC